MQARGPRHHQALAFTVVLNDPVHDEEILNGLFEIAEISCPLIGSLKAYGDVISADVLPVAVPDVQRGFRDPSVVSCCLMPAALLAAVGICCVDRNGEW
ncbi:hypothetical protein D3C78_1460570 [compost metagenome]